MPAPMVINAMDPIMTLVINGADTIERYNILPDPRVTCAVLMAPVTGAAPATTVVAVIDL
jgi:hypothetical protein